MSSNRLRLWPRSTKRLIVGHGSRTPGRPCSGPFLEIQRWVSPLSEPLIRPIGRVVIKILRRVRIILAGHLRAWLARRLAVHGALDHDKILVPACSHVEMDLVVGDEIMPA